MTESTSSAFAKVQAYAEELQEAQSAQNRADSAGAGAGAGSSFHDALLDRTIQKLREEVKQKESTIEKLQTTSTAQDFDRPSEDPLERLIQLRAMKTAFDELSSTAPTLPSLDSPLPALLALRTTQQTIIDTKRSILDLEQTLTETKSRLDQEKVELRDARLITGSLENRIEELQAAKHERSSKTPAQAGKDMIKDLHKKNSAYENERMRLIDQFNAFIDDRLAAMLAAEELGGPVTGDLLELEDDVLIAGFSSQGRAKRIKPTIDEDKRQHRIDQIWGPAIVEDEGERYERSEKDAAGAEIRALTEELLNASAEASGSGSAAYILLRRESAAARFLVRAKVAQFHPQDARKLRLVDFGRELDE